VSAAASAAPSARGRGRPPRLSREQILDAAVSLIQAAPSENLTIRRVAAAVGATPMSLYRYFAGHEELLHAVAERVAAPTLNRRSAGALWHEDLRQWLLVNVEHAQAYPQLVPYLASTQRAAWLPSFVLLSDILRPLDLGEADLAAAIALVGTTIVGLATLTAHAPATRGDLEKLHAVMAEDFPDDQSRIRPALDRVLGSHGDLVETVVTQTIRTIGSLAPHAPNR
jgi:TetR/AcrR family tetracycline transcriptional repressor